MGCRLLPNICIMFLMGVSFVFLSHLAEGQERSIDFSANSINNASLEQYEQKIQTLKNTLVTIANEVGEIKDCHSQRLIYTSGGCVNPITPESDPARAAQANVSTPLSVCPSGEAHQWNGTSWSCKEIRIEVNSGVPSDQGTWQMLGGESCWDHYIRACVSADDTCPTPGNPIATACVLGTPSCNYTTNGANSFIEYICR
jgi:hypothetical protein